MRGNVRQPVLVVLFIVSMGLPGVLGFWDSRALEERIQSDALDPGLQIVNTSTTTLLPATRTIQPPTSTESPIVNLVTPDPASATRLFAFIQAPVGLVPEPFVILTAFSSIPRPGQISIRGFSNGLEFICDATPCKVILQSESRVVFRAFDEFGNVSPEVIAVVTLTPGTDGYLVTISHVSQFTTFVDSCSLVWGLGDETNATWDSFVQFPFELNTTKTLHTLTTQLILKGIVDTKDCPGGGLNLSLNWPTACGLERASRTMIDWQNQFDPYIWLASSEQGIPPKVLKTLLEVESQFWPGNSRFYLDEFGLGQINQLGMDVLLRRDGIFYQKVCEGTLSDCSIPYLSLEAPQQALIRGAAMSMMDAECPSCPNGIDLDKAKQSVSIIAMLLRANCERVDAILTNAVTQAIKADPDLATATAAAPTPTPGGDINYKTTYEDMWRFTFLAYHSGLRCFQDAALAVTKARLPVTWENLDKELDCRGGREYVDGMMANLFAFDSYLDQSINADNITSEFMFVPTNTPIPTPTVYISYAKVLVRVFMDRNGNGVPEDGEWIDAMTVLLTTSDNQQITQRTQNGIAVFDMTGFPPATIITVSLPGLYRSESFALPEQGVSVVTFIFEPPPLPTLLP